MASEAVWPRGIAWRLQESLADTPVVLLNGPRQCGKTTLVRQFATEQRPYLTLDDATTSAAARDDPQGFIRRSDATYDLMMYRDKDQLEVDMGIVNGLRKPAKWSQSRAASLRQPGR